MKKDITYEELVEALSIFPMENYNQTQKITTYACLALERGDWNVKAIEEQFILDRGRVDVRNIVYLNIGDVVFNAKGETRDETLDGRYRILKGAKSGGVAPVGKGDPWYEIDADLMREIESQLSTVQQKRLQSSTSPARAAAAGPRL